MEENKKYLDKDGLNRYDKKIKSHLQSEIGNITNIVTNSKEPSNLNNGDIWECPYTVV